MSAPDGVTYAPALKPELTKPAFAIGVGARGIAPILRAYEGPPPPPTGGAGSARGAGGAGGAYKRPLGALRGAAGCGLSSLYQSLSLCN